MLKNAHDNFKALILGYKRYILVIVRCLFVTMLIANKDYH